MENLILKKIKISGVAQNGSISADWIFRVANFGFDYLSHFFNNFANSCAHLVANFLNFSKHPLTLIIWWFWRELWTKNQKNRCWKICHFEPTLKFNLFWDWDFSTFFLIITKIDRERPEIIDWILNSVSRNWAILSNPWNLTCFEDEIFQFFS